LIKLVNITFVSSKRNNNSKKINDYENK